MAFGRSGIVAKQQVWGTQYIDELVQVGLNQHASVDDSAGNACQRFFWACQDRAGKETTCGAK